MHSEWQTRKVLPPYTFDMIRFMPSYTFLFVHFKLSSGAQFCNYANSQEVGDTFDSSMSLIVSLTLLSELEIFILPITEHVPILVHDTSTPCLLLVSRHFTSMKHDGCGAGLSSAHR
jgi:hypothetical protein